MEMAQILYYNIKFILLLVIYFSINYFMQVPNLAQAMALITL